MSVGENTDSLGGCRGSRQCQLEKILTVVEVVGVHRQCQLAKILTVWEVAGGARQCQFGVHRVSVGENTDSLGGGRGSRQCQLQKY